MKILFVSHSLDASGAPLLLLSIVRSLSAAGVTCFVFSPAKEGPLKQAFSETSTLVLADSTLKNRLQYEWLNALIQFHAIDLVYFNTIAALTVEPWIRAGNKAVHVHELASVIEQYSKPVFERLKKATDLKVITLSKSTKTYLETLNPALNIHYSPFFHDFSVLKTGNENPFPSITGNTFPVILGCGTVEPRKGVDLFIQTAVYYSRYINASVNFVWLGLSAKRNYAFFMDRDRALSGLKTVFLHTATHEVAPFFEHSSLLFMPSREDSFGRVMLESAFFKKPVLAYKAAGGPEELLYETELLLDSYGDVRHAAETISALLNNPEKMQALGEELNRRALSAHGQDTQLPAFLALIRAVAGSPK